MWPKRPDRPGLRIRLRGGGAVTGNLFELSDSRDEFISATGDGHDVGVLVRAFVEGAAKGGDVPGQGRVFDGDVPPHAADELVFLDISATLDARGSAGREPCTG